MKKRMKLANRRLRFLTVYTVALFCLGASAMAGPDGRKCADLNGRYRLGKLTEACQGNWVLGAVLLMHFGDWIILEPETTFEIVQQGCNTLTFHHMTPEPHVDTFPAVGPNGSRSYKFTSSGIKHHERNDGSSALALSVGTEGVSASLNRRPDGSLVYSESISDFSLGLVTELSHHKFSCVMTPVKDAEPDATQPSAFLGGSEARAENRLGPKLLLDERRE